jgi:hypothetical protein
MRKLISLFGFTLGLVAAIAGVIAVYVRRIRPWHVRWGATDREVERSLPGDDLVPDPKINTTHAVTIDAPVDKVWPWIAQLGRGRGGFYSYDWIENLMGLDIHNADRVLPEYQDINVGDAIPFAEGFDVPVAIVEPQHALVVHGDTREAPPDVMKLQPGEFFNVSWGWFVEPLDGDRTRLIERWRADYAPSYDVPMRAFMEPSAFVMQRKMLLGIKERAEALAHQNLN